MSCLCFQSSHDLHQLKKGIAPPPGKYNIASALSFHVIQYNSGCFFVAPVSHYRELALFDCRFLREMLPKYVTADHRLHSVHPLTNPVNRNGGTYE
mgnify:CR=1 FL=1